MTRIKSKKVLTNRRTSRSKNRNQPLLLELLESRRCMASDVFMPIEPVSTPDAVLSDIAWVSNPAPGPDLQQTQSPTVDNPVPVNELAPADMSPESIGPLLPDDYFESGTTYGPIEPELPEALAPTDSHEPMGPLLPLGPEIGPQRPDPSSNPPSNPSESPIHITLPLDPSVLPNPTAPSITLPGPTESNDLLDASELTTSHRNPSATDEAEIVEGPSREIGANRLLLATVTIENAKQPPVTLQPSIAAVEPLPIATLQFLSLENATKRMELPEVMSTLAISPDAVDKAIAVHGDTDVSDSSRPTDETVAYFTAATLAAFEARRKQADEAPIDLPSIAVVQMLMPIQSWMIFASQADGSTIPTKAKALDSQLVSTRTECETFALVAGSGESEPNAAQDDKESQSVRSTHSLLFMAIVGLLGIPQTIKKSRRLRKPRLRLRLR